MPLTERSHRALTAAIAVLTASFSDEDREGQFAFNTLLKYVDDNDLSDPELVLGFWTLATILLVKLEVEGQNPIEVLQDVARRYQPPRE